MDTAGVTSDGTLAPAGGVERCECPPQYNSSSCQDPSVGFYRWFGKTSSTATILINLVGEARACECNGRSKMCDKETGACAVSTYVSYSTFAFTGNFFYLEIKIKDSKVVAVLISHYVK